MTKKENTLQISNIYKDVYRSEKLHSFRRILAVLIIKGV